MEDLCTPAQQGKRPKEAAIGKPSLRPEELLQSDVRQGSPAAPPGRLLPGMVNTL